MNIKGKAMSGSSILTILGVVCFATVLVAATITWSTYDTAHQDPVTQVSLGTPTTDEWTGDYVPDGAHTYDVAFTVNYNYGSESSFTYYLMVDAVADTGTTALDDFTINLSGVTASFAEVSAGHWVSTGILKSDSDMSDNINFAIIPNAGSIDLGGVSFTFSAVSSLT